MLCPHFIPILLMARFITELTLATRLMTEIAEASVHSSPKFKLHSTQYS
jgi:hypothetical protein